MPAVYKLNICKGDKPVSQTMIFDDITIATEWRNWLRSKGHDKSHIVTESVVQFMPPNYEARVKRALCAS
jgi:hypothetical protein